MRGKIANTKHLTDLQARGFAVECAKRALSKYGDRVAHRHLTDAIAFAERMAFGEDIAHEDRMSSLWWETLEWRDHELAPYGVTLAIALIGGDGFFALKEVSDQCLVEPVLGEDGKTRVYNEHLRADEDEMRWQVRRLIELLYPKTAVQL